MTKRMKLMSKKLTIKNDKVSEYLGTQDAIKGLQKVVDNGQTRLALEVVSDIISQIVDRIAALEEVLLLQSNSLIDETPATEQAKSVTKTKETTTQMLEEEKK